MLFFRPLLYLFFLFFNILKLEFYIFRSNKVVEIVIWFVIKIIARLTARSS